MARLRDRCEFRVEPSRYDTRAIQDWLGHRLIQRTVRYTELSPTRIKDFGVMVYRDIRDVVSAGSGD
jgi:hypothetical protein